MMEPLGASQVLSYLYKLSVHHQYVLISMEKEEDLKNTDDLHQLKKKIERFNINWIPVSYKSDKFGKFFNFFRFIWVVLKTIKKEKIKFIHCRSYVTAFAAFFAQYFFNIKYLFDTRNFSFDERADIGSLNREGMAYKFGKWIEKKLYYRACGIIILSKNGKDTIQNNELFKGGDKLKNIEIITTCVDLDRFKLLDRDYNKEPITIGYVGTATGWYDFDKTVITLSKLKKYFNFKFLIFNNNQYNQHQFIREKLLKNNINETSFQIEKVDFSKIPERLKEMDLSLFYIHPYFSKRASAATKLGELLATGIPVITNGGVGDHEYLIEKYKVGKIINFEKIDTYDFKNIFEELRNIETAQRCRLLAEEYFSLEKGVEKYLNAYQKYFINE